MKKRPFRADYDSAEYRGCARKHSYVSERNAQQHADKRSAASGKPLYVYRCKFCKGWHLTSAVQGAPSRSSTERRAA